MTIHRDTRGWLSLLLLALIPVTASMTAFTYNPLFILAAGVLVFPLLLLQYCHTADSLVSVLSSIGIGAYSATVVHVAVHDIAMRKGYESAFPDTAYIALGIVASIIVFIALSKRKGNM
ncbi:hypothetical protein QTV49_004297 [Vibrio vulnificus]|nr:hypothetical protein [Vibrio vulnificus]